MAGLCTMNDDAGHRWTMSRVITHGGGCENSAGGWDYQSFLQTNRVVADEWFTVKVI